MTEELVYVAFYKPYGVLTAFTDPEGRETLKQYVDVPDVYPAGRLDFDSEGLLLLTNDGDLAHRLTDPRYNHPKTYLVQVEGEPTPDALARLQSGVDVKGHITRRAQAMVVPEPDLPPRRKPITPHGPTAWLRVVLTEGKKRQVRHMTASVGLPTLRLVRVAIGPIALNELQPGEWRTLTAAEVKLLKDMVKTGRPVAGPRAGAQSGRADPAKATWSPWREDQQAAGKGKTGTAGQSAGEKSRGKAGAKKHGLPPKPKHLPKPTRTLAADRAAAAARAAGKAPDESQSAAAKPPARRRTGAAGPAGPGKRPANKQPAAAEKRPAAADRQPAADRRPADRRPADKRPGETRPADKRPARKPPAAGGSQRASQNPTPKAGRPSKPRRTKDEE